MTEDFQAEEELRQAMISVCRDLHRQGLVAGTEGNASARLGRDRLLVTPSGRGLGALRAGDLVLTDAGGRSPAGAGSPTSELPMHLAVMEARGDVGAVLHAHPPCATAFAMVGEPLPGDLHPEIAALEGEVPLVDYATPGSPELAEALARRLPDHDALLLAGHGVLCLGADLERALWRLERIEQFARTLAVARSLGRPRELPPGEAERLGRRWRRKL